MNTRPLVSCVMIVTGEFEPLVGGITHFLNQDYSNLELVMIQCGGDSVEVLIPQCPKIHFIYQPDPATSAESRNKACTQTSGDIIIHWNEATYYAEDWISRQVNALNASGADICGLNKTTELDSWSELQERRIENPDETIRWIIGSTLCYWKKLWVAYPFSTSQTDENTDFILNSGGKVYSHDYSKGYKGQEDLIPIPNKSTLLPLVSCIMTTRNSTMLIPFMLHCFLCQDYPNVELIIIDDGIMAAPELILHCPNTRYFFLEGRETKGAKRNVACSQSNGSIILHWDDQDWYAHDWIKHQVTALLTSGADMSGLHVVQTYSMPNQKSVTTEKSSWLYEGTMVYWKSVWENNKFKTLKTGESEDFQQQPGIKIIAHDYIEGFNTNTYIKKQDRQLPNDPLVN